MKTAKGGFMTSSTVSDNTTTTTFSFSDKTKYSISKKKCLAMGGHCYEVSNYVIDTMPPIYHRVCKHCGHKQEGVRQPEMDWRDD